MLRRVVPAALLIAVACASSASAAQRYASSTGLAVPPCVALAPCDLTTAIQGASTGDEVIVTPGVTPYALSTEIIDTVALNIHGVAGQPAPVIVSSAFTALGVDNGMTTIALLDIRDTDPGGGPLIFQGAMAEQITARGGGSGNSACDMAGGVLRDSICIATDSGAAAIILGGGTTTEALRNVTAIATSTLSGFGIEGLNQQTTPLVITATNVIARGATDDIAANDFMGMNTHHEEIDVDHSDYVSHHADASSSVVAGTGNITTAPVFDFPAAFDYHEASNSPTVDAGITAAINGGQDFEGDARTIGASTDMGGDELALAPTVSTVSAAVTGPTTANVNATINPGGATTAYDVAYGPTAAYGSTTVPVALPAATGTFAVVVLLTGLSPGTTYHYAIQASNPMGAAPAVDQTFTTPPAAVIPSTSTSTKPPPPPRPPSITTLAISPKRFAVKTKAKEPAHPHHGATVSIDLSEVASVRFTLNHVSTGRRVGKTCHRATKANRHRAACSLLHAVGGFTDAKAARGITRIPLPARIGGRVPPVGKATLVAVATAGGSASAPKSVSFTILAG